jgi:hypothetical protein
MVSFRLPPISLLGESNNLLEPYHVKDRRGASRFGRPVRPFCSCSILLYGFGRSTQCGTAAG